MKNLSIEYLKLSQKDNFDDSELSDCSSGSQDSTLNPDAIKIKVTPTRNTHPNKMKLDIYEELVESKKRDYKKIFVACLASAIVLALIITLAVLLTGNDKDDPSAPPAKDGSTIGLNDILSGKLSASRFNGTWLAADSQIMYRDPEGAVNVYDVPSGNIKVVLGTQNEELAEGFKFELSADQKYLIVAKGYRKIFRHSFLAMYDIVELQTNQIIPITVNSKKVPLSLIQWCSNTNALFFVFNNNLYYKASPLANEVQLTNDTDPSMYNGVPDWVYEEEVFSSNVATWASTDGKKLAFINFNDTYVPVMKIPIYGIPGLQEYQYPHEALLHYPKAGVKNPEVKLFRVNLETSAKFEIQPPAELVNPNNDHIITSVGWADNDTLISIWKNRIQNHAIIQSCDAANKCQIVQEIKSSDGWLELFSEPIFNNDGSQFLLITSQDQGAAGGYRHLTMLSTKKPGSVAITKGNFVVQDILKWDTATNLIFYTANSEKESHELHIYAIKGEEGAKPMCVSCGIKNGPAQSYFGAQMSKAGNFVVLTAQGPDIPTVNVYEWIFDNKSSVSLKHKLEWESNEDIQHYLSAKKSPKVMYKQVQLDNGYVSKVKLWVPENADLSGAVKYPMLVDVYGGPNSYSVIDTWSMDWGSYMSANRSIIYAKIDGRGSGLRGDKILHQIYKRLGTVEIEDQISTAEKLQETLAFIDPNRTAIWGWSYGGYASAMSLAKDKHNVFKCAASVAPVTDWTYYDSIYTERYMRLPITSDNKVNYENSRLTALAESFRRKSYLLIHGTLDDNVHFQQSMAFSRVLERNDIMFKQVSYPDEDHSLAGVRPHLYHTLGKFFNECFNLKD